MECYFKPQQRNALFREFHNVASCQTGKNIPVNESPDGSLGYSTEKSEIFLSTRDPVYKPMSEYERPMFLRGVFAHELLHLLITNFPVYIKAIQRQGSRFQQEIYSNFLNIAEDGAIENFAPDYLSREYTRTLEFVRAQLYKSSPIIKEEDIPLQQFLNAVLEFRFFGFLKSTIYDPKAKAVFAKCIPLIAQCFEEPAQAGRVKLVDECFEIARPLWEELVNESSRQQDELEKLMNDLLNQFGVAKNTGSGTGSDDSDPHAGSESGIRRRRKITVKKVSAEEYKRLKEEAKDAPQGGGDGDITIITTDEPLDDNDDDDKAASCKDASSGRSSESGENEEGNDSTGSSDYGDAYDADNASDETDGDSTSNSSDTTGTDASHSAKANPSGSSKSARSTPNSHEVDMSDIPASNEMRESSATMEDELNKELVLTEEDILAINQTYDHYEADDTKQEKGVSPDETLFDFKVDGGYKNVCGKAKCQNIVVRCPVNDTAKSRYNDIAKSMSSQITLLTNNLRRILKNRQEEKMYKTDGKVSVKRLYGGRVTSRVFTKRRLPDSSELAAVVAVDISGSMSGYKIQMARQAAIGLAEVMGNLKIPVYIFGFTADENGFDANHYHYLNWSNKPSDRYSLLQIDAMCDNFDGYSIRYAAQLLHRKNAEKKLLLVISDGMPACNAYGYGLGVEDAKLAITEANREATTIGILLGNNSPQHHREMYGYNFIHCENPNDLFTKLSGILKRYI